MCTAEDFSAEDKASGVKFCTVVRVARALADSSSAQATRRIGMCGCSARSAVPEDGRTCITISNLLLLLLISASKNIITVPNSFWKTSTAPDSILPNLYTEHNTQYGLS